MAEDFFQFRQEVSAVGYRVVESRSVNKKTPQRFLTDGVSFGSSYDSRTSFPLEETSGLFLTFGELGLSDQEIIGFANRYGLLGVKEGQPIPVADKPRVADEGKRRQLLGWGEPVGRWRDQIGKVKRALQVWEAWRKKDVDQLKKWINWPQADAVLYEHESHGAWRGIILADKKSHINLAALEQFTPGDVFQPALACVQKLINEQLVLHVSPKLLWETNPRRREKLVSETNWDRLGLYLAPTNLIGAMWLQFARAVAGNKQYRRCRECNDRFEISPSVARSDREFCRDACKVRAYRARKDEAKRLSKRRVPLKEIAEQVNSDVGTVRGWLKEKSR